MTNSYHSSLRYSLTLSTYLLTFYVIGGNMLQLQVHRSLPAFFRRWKLSNYDFHKMIQIRETHRVPIGISDFAELASPNNNYNFVDKTLLIKEFFDSGEKASLITRPRRHLKSTNLSMVQHFCAESVFGKTTKGLFDSLAISKVDEGKYMSYQGQYPTIYLSFIDIKDGNLKVVKERVKMLIRSCYNDHADVLLKSDRLPSYKKKIITNVLNNSVSDIFILDSLKLLSEYSF